MRGSQQTSALSQQVLVLLGACELAFEREHPTLEAQDLGQIHSLPPARPFDLRQAPVDQVKGGA